MQMPCAMSLLIFLSICNMLLPFIPRDQRWSPWQEDVCVSLQKDTSDISSTVIVSSTEPLGSSPAPLITNLPPPAPQNWAEVCGDALAPPRTQQHCPALGVLPLVVSADSKLFFHSLFYLLFLTGGLGGKQSGETESGFLRSLRVQLNWLRMSVGLCFEVSVALLLHH